MNDVNSQSDSSVDSMLDDALGSLRTVVPRVGIEARINATLVARADALEREPTPARGSWISGWRVIPAAFACVALIAAELLIDKHPAHRAPSITATATASLDRPRTSATAGAVAAKGPSMPRLQHHASSSTFPIATMSTPGVPASFPAPPLPLTQQERLLLRVAYRGDPVQAAPLNAVHRDAQQAVEIAEFHAYFPPDHKEIPQ